MKILITGANGQLGRSLQRALARYQVVAAGHAVLDVADAEAVTRCIADGGFDVVVHAAALTDTPRCEREPASADAINARGTGNVAVACARSHARLVAISTDEVFAGDKRTPYVEGDTTHAVSAYGRSKLKGEELVEKSGADALIARTSWLYGDGGNNFPSKVMAAARAGRPLRFVTNEVSVPTSTDDLAVAVRALIEKAAPGGMYHLVSEGEASRYEWALEILRLAGMADVPIEPVTMQELRAGGYDGPQKPEYSVMANTRARDLGITLPPWRETLVDYIARMEIAADG